MSNPSYNISDARLTALLVGAVIIGTLAGYGALSLFSDLGWL